MIKECQELNPSSELRSEIVASLREVLQRNSNLAESVLQVLKSGTPETLQQVQATLDVISQLSRLSLSMVAAHAEVIFPEEKFEVPKAARPKVMKKEMPEVVKVGTRALEIETTPQTFDGLLEERILAQLPNRETVAEAEIVKIVKKSSTVRKAIAAEGLPARKSEFSRQEAVRIITRILTTPRSDFKLETSYSYSQIVNRFGITQTKLDELSSAIKFDWEQIGTVDLATVLQIRGLAQLDKILTR